MSKQEILKRLELIKEKIAEYEARKIGYQMNGDIDNAHLMVKAIREAKKAFSKYNYKYKRL